MFSEIYRMLSSYELKNISPEIEILKGWFEKTNSRKEYIAKAKRKYSYKV